jgi:hypothetical protein
VDQGSLYCGQPGKLTAICYEHDGTLPSLYGLWVVQAAVSGCVDAEWQQEYDASNASVKVVEIARAEVNVSEDDINDIVLDNCRVGTPDGSLFRKSVKVRF